ncbi:DUF2690 domain-containing protein [Streptomyces sp. NPDC020801]|uniref:DUF2690 domain-containing protein n=1 Tax=unclassified Streptomyces TaxID=2593676 RepID=UPI0037892B5C
MEAQCLLGHLGFDPGRARTAARAATPAAAPVGGDRSTAGDPPTDLAEKSTRGGRRTARVELRYSASCGAAWARMWRSRVGDHVQVWVPGSAPQRVGTADGYDEEGYLFTPVIDGTDLTGVRIRICFEPARGTGQECFRR